MKANILFLSIICLLLSGCMETTTNKANTKNTSPAISCNNYDLANSTSLKSKEYTSKKMKWIVISTNKILE